MTRPDLWNLDLTGKTIVIIGRPASGKTTIGNALSARTGTRIIHTDEYIQHGNTEGLYVLLADLAGDTIEPVIIEGVMGYRLLRKGVEMDCFYPDVVIELEVSDEQVERVYKEQRTEKRSGNLSAFNKGLQTILNQYRDMPNPRPPVWYVIKNEF